MTNDQDLRERFASLRAQTEQGAPSIEAITARKRREHRPPAGAWAGVTALTILATLLAVRFLASPAPPAEPSIAGWRSPTAFLLDAGPSSRGIVRGRGDFPSSFLSPKSQRPVGPPRSNSSRETFS